MSPQLRSALHSADRCLHPAARAVPEELWRGRILLLGLAMGVVLTFTFLVAFLVSEGPGWDLLPLAAITGTMLVLAALVGRMQRLRRLGEALIISLALLVPLNSVWGPGSGLGTLACAAIVPTLASYYTGPAARTRTLALLSALLIGVIAAIIGGADFPLASPSRLGAALTVTAIAASVWMAHLIGTLNEARDQEALARLRESETRQALAIRATAAGVLEWDPGGDSCLLSPRMESWLELPASPDGRHRPARVLAALPGDAAAALARSLAGLRADGEVLSVETRMGYGTQLRWLRWDALAERGPLGIRVVALVRDVSEEHRVQTLHDNFMATISHELRTPLTTIQGALALLKVGATGELSAEGRELVERAALANTRLTGLVDDLLNLRDLDSGKLPARFEPVEIGPLLVAVATPHLELAHAREVKLEVCARGLDGVLLDSDPDSLASALDHLILNALQFTRRHSTVTVRGWVEDSAVEISVADQGGGVPEAFRPRLFSRFAQASAGASREHGGMGIGLAVARGLVSSVGGELGYRPEAAGGSTFWLRLPLPQADSTGQDAEQSVA